MSVRTIAVWTMMACTTGCVTRPPTIAHVHIGHAITGVHVTPGQKGYIPLADQRAHEALAAAQLAGQAADLASLKANVASVAAASDNPDNFGVKQTLILAANHISFAATSADASENVIQFAATFKTNITGVVSRCDYITLLSHDVAQSTSLKEASLAAQEILKAATVNLQGDANAGSGSQGAEFGVTQLNAQIQAMIGREKPPYRTVDAWYLFNLVRLPNGRWVFDKLGRGGNIDGYK
jgi:hypothetical protein